MESGSCLLYSSKDFWEKPWSVRLGANWIDQDRLLSDSSLEGRNRDQAVLNLLLSLQPALTSIAIDYATVVFSPSVSSPPQNELQLLLCSLRVMKQLYRRVLRMGNTPMQVFEQELWPYLTHLAPHFPAVFPPLLRKDIKVSRFIVQNSNSMGRRRLKWCIKSSIYCLRSWWRLPSLPVIDEMIWTRPRLLAVARRYF